jgi:GNAT superfamily N-acetyltransferase
VLCDDAWMTGPVELRPGSLADLPALESLWVSVHHQHAQSMPELAPYVDDTRTWAARSQLYRELLGQPGTILPACRGQGIGSRLLDELISRLTAAGVHDLVLGVLPGNTAAIRLYERYGFRPTWSYLSRFSGR